MALSKAQIKVIEKDSQKYEAASALILIDLATDLSKLYAQESTKLIQESNNAIAKATKEPVKIVSKTTETNVAKSIADTYKSGMISKKGSVCVEKVVEELKDGRIKTYTRKRFIPWLQDMNDARVKDVSKIINEGIKSGKNPRIIAKDLESIFKGTSHNPSLVARTEAEKIRAETMNKSYTENGVKYVLYRTAQDDRVRISHQSRDGLIFEINKAPDLSEPNCRCVLVPADYMVENKGAKVEESQVLILPKGTDISKI